MNELKQLNVATKNYNGQFEIVDSKARNQLNNIQTVVNETSTQVSKLSGEIDELNGFKIYYELEWILNEYVDNKDGSVKSYNGWDRTNYTEIPSNVSLMNVISPKDSAYNCFYDEGKHYIKNFTVYGNATTEIEIPQNAKFFILSGGQYHGGRYSETKAKNKITSIEELREKMDSMENPLSNSVIYWGDSLTQGNQDGTGVTRATVMQSLLGDKWVVKNYGAGGEQSNTIACRQGGLNLVVKPNQTIPSSGSVNLEIVDNEGNAVNLRSSTQNGYVAYESLNPCYINGIKGTLTNGTSLGTSPYKFTRETSGDAVDIRRPTTLVTNAMMKYVGGIAIIEIGQNGGFNGDAETLVRQIKQMLDFNNCNKYLVCGFVTAGKTEFNEAMAKAFGRHFIDTMKYASTPIYGDDGNTIVSSYGLDDMNLPMTSTDLERINNGLMPKSLQVEDNIHLNQYGYTMQANLEYQRGKDLGYWS